MQSDPQDEQWTLPESRDGEPRDPVGDEQGAPHGEPADAPRAPDMPAPGATPPRMPAPPQMPGATPPSAWGSPAPSPPTPRGMLPQPQAGETAAHTREEPAGAEAAKDVESDAPVVESQGEAMAADADVPAVEPEVPIEGGAPAKGVVRPGPKTGVAPVVQGDWLASVCPYLTSDDGTYRSAAPDEGHRCTAQDPAATLPLAFQERFCLTDRHPRCEMFKFAQETDSAGSIPVAAVPPTDPPTSRTGSGGAGGAGGGRRPLLAMLAGIGGLIVVVILVVVFMGSCSSDDDGSVSDPDLVPDEQAIEAPASTPASGPEATPEAAETPDTTQDAGVDETVRVLYEIQPGEALLRVSETFGVTRNRLRRENPQLEGVDIGDLPGLVIEVPIVGDMTLAEVEALAGYVGPVTDIEG